MLAAAAVQPMLMLRALAQVSGPVLPQVLVLLPVWSRPVAQELVRV